MRALIPNTPVRSQSSVSISTAIRLSWLCLALLMSIPFLAAVWLFWHTGGQQTPQLHGGAERWFVASMIFLAIMASLAFFWCEYVSASGKTLSAGKYLAGTIIVGSGVVSAGLLSLIGCLISGSLMPGLIPGFLAMLVFLLLWLTGRAMVQRVDSQENPRVH